MILCNKRPTVNKTKGPLPQRGNPGDVINVVHALRNVFLFSVHVVYTGVRTETMALNVFDFENESSRKFVVHRHHDK